MKNSLNNPEESIFGNIAWKANNSTPYFKRGYVPIAYFVRKELPFFQQEQITDCIFIKNGDGFYIMVNISSCDSLISAETKISDAINRLKTFPTNIFFFTNTLGHII